MSACFVGGLAVAGEVDPSQQDWFKKYKKWIKLNVNNDYQLTEYRFFDQHQDEIRLGTLAEA